MSVHAYQSRDSDVSDQWQSGRRRFRSGQSCLISHVLKSRGRLSSDISTIQIANNNNNNYTVVYTWYNNNVIKIVFIAPQTELFFVMISNFSIGRLPIYYIRNPFNYYFQHTVKPLYDGESLGTNAFFCYRANEIKIFNNL